jgi:hypothetical protein
MQIKRAYIRNALCGKGRDKYVDYYHGIMPILFSYLIKNIIGELEIKSGKNLFGETEYNPEVLNTIGITGWTENVSIA